MIVYLAGLGSNWARKNHPDGNSAWINTTGIPRSLAAIRGSATTQVRRRWTFQGSVRFEANNFPWIGTPKDLIGLRCFSPGLEKIVNDETRLRIVCPARKSQRIDAFLVCIHSYDYGFVNRSHEWKSKNVKLISASGGRGGHQEILLLVQNNSWIRTSHGLWRWNITFGSNGKPRIELDPTHEELLELEGAI